MCPYRLEDMETSSVFDGLSINPSDDHLKLRTCSHGASVDIPASTIDQTFENIVDEQPTAIAAKYGDKTLTFSQLDASANRLAHHLIDLGLTPKQRVCLVVQRSLETIVGILAVLKAGCQYVPIDGEERSDMCLAHIFQDSGTAFVLCLPMFETRVRQQAQEGVVVVAMGVNTEISCSPERLHTPRTEQDGAVAIYISGTTGRPKGVGISHRSLLNALTLEPGKLGISRGSKVAQVLSVGFDMAAWEIFACLLNGGTLYIRGSRWEDTLRQVDTLITTPSVLSKYRKQHYPNIRTVVTGGEPCPQSLADEWVDGTTFYNSCGSTEAGIFSTIHNHRSAKALTIGKPTPNTSVYILDAERNLVPFGEKGVLWIGGAGVARGYINLPELTASRFKEDRFGQYGTKMFNTGDIVRWNETGSLELLGRIDEQIKIRGFRVELDGVAAVIEKFPGITRACACLIDGQLRGFYTTVTFIDEEDLTEFVTHRLPAYSRPTGWTYLSSLPLTAEGKVDKEKLAKHSLRSTRTMSSRKSYDPKNLYRASTVKTAKLPVTEEIEMIELLPTQSLAGKPVENELPRKKGFSGARWLRHRAFNLYRRFFTVVIIANIAAAAIILYRRVRGKKPMMGDLAIASASNLTAAVLVRSEPVVNLLFTVFCSVPTSWPLGIRRYCAKIFHMDGIHSGCAIATVMWFTIFTIGGSLDFDLPVKWRCVSMTAMVLSYVINIIFLVLLALSYPSVRARKGVAWELTYRFGGWAVIILLWAHTIIVTQDLHLVPSTPMNKLVTSPPIWLLAVTTLTLVFRLFLRKVAVRTEFLSEHASRLHFDYTTPLVGTSVQIAERPLVDWHSFPAIPSPDGNGFSILLSHTSRFNKRTMQRSPTSIWVQGVPICGILRIAPLFKSIVLVAIGGTGFGPALAVLLEKKTPCRILWVSENPEQTFGKTLVDGVRTVDPNAVIHNTRVDGGLDVVLVAWRMYREAGAEAVLVLGGKREVGRVVYGLEKRGIVAFGGGFGE